MKIDQQTHLNLWAIARDCVVEARPVLLAIDRGERMTKAIRGALRVAERVWLDYGLSPPARQQRPDTVTLDLLTLVCAGHAVITADTAVHYAECYRWKRASTFRTHLLALQDIGDTYCCRQYSDMSATMVTSIFYNGLTIADPPRTRVPLGPFSAYRKCTDADNAGMRDALLTWAAHYQQAREEAA